MATDHGIRVDCNADELVKALAAMRRRGENLSGTMAAAAEVLVAAVSDEFSTAGRGSWDPLAESTLRKRRGSTAQILMDTGRFAGSIEAYSGDDFAEAATDVSYAVFHVSDAPRSRIPKRDPFDIDPERISEAEAMILDAIVGA